MPGTVLIRNPPSRTIARVVLAGAWLLFGLHLTLSGPACLAYAGPAASCQASVSPLDGILLLVTIPLLIAAGASAYAHIVVGNDGVRPVGIRALIFRRHDVYAWPDITKVTPVTTSHRWTFFTVYVSRHLELSVKGKLNPVRLPAPRAGLLVSGRQYRERATKLQRIWLAQTGQTDGS